MNIKPVFLINNNNLRARIARTNRDIIYRTVMFDIIKTYRQIDFGLSYSDQFLNYAYKDISPEKIENHKTNTRGILFYYVLNHFHSAQIELAHKTIYPDYIKNIFIRGFVDRDLSNLYIGFSIPSIMLPSVLLLRVRANVYSLLGSSRYIITSDITGVENIVRQFT